MKLTPEGLELHSPGNTIFIYPKQNHVPATFTVLNFPVRYMEAAVDDLSKRGVHFEEYEEGELKSDKKGSPAATGRPSPGSKIQPAIFSLIESDPG